MKKIVTINKKEKVKKVELGSLEGKEKETWIQNQAVWRAGVTIYPGTNRPVSTFHSDVFPGRQYGDFRRFEIFLIPGDN